MGVEEVFSREIQVIIRKIIHLVEDQELFCYSIHFFSATGPPSPDEEADPPPEAVCIFKKGMKY